MAYKETQKSLTEAEDRFKKWFYDRGFKEYHLMAADAAYKKYLATEQEMNYPDKRPWDKAPGFRRIFMMGYFYGRDAANE